MRGAGHNIAPPNDGGKFHMNMNEAPFPKLLAALAVATVVPHAPVADTAGLPSLRVVSEADQNVRIDVATGAVTVDAMLLAGNPPGSVNPTIGGSAYTNNVFGASSTTLYNIDYNFDRLVIQSPPN